MNLIVTQINYWLIKEESFTINLCKKKLRVILKLLNLKLMIESELQSIRIFLVKVTQKIGQEKFITKFCFEN